jgi:hypothetical protein
MSDDKLKAIRRGLGDLTNALCFLADVCERYDPDPASGYMPPLAGLAALMNGFAAQTEDMAQQVNQLIGATAPRRRRRPELVTPDVHTEQDGAR